MTWVVERLGDLAGKRYHEWAGMVYYEKEVRFLILLAIPCCLCLAAAYLPLPGSTSAPEEEASIGPLQLAVVRMLLSRAVHIWHMHRSVQFTSTETQNDMFSKVLAVL
jgi:hypothetical protein